MLGMQGLELGTVFVGIPIVSKVHEGSCILKPFPRQLFFSNVRFHVIRVLALEDVDVVQHVLVELINGLGIRQLLA